LLTKLALKNSKKQMGKQFRLRNRNRDLFSG